MSGHLDRAPAVEHALDRSGPLPLYHQLKQWLYERILTGEFSPGAQLPGELELCERFGLSRGVVRQALSELGHEGLVSRERGRGTFVSVPKTPEGLISGLRGLADDAALRGETVESTVLLLRERSAGTEVARRLELEPGERVVELERLRTIDGVPHVLVMTYLPAALVPGLTARDLGGRQSLYRILREEYGLPVVASVRRVEATLADARGAHLLRVHPGDPLLVLRSVGYTTRGRPLDYFVARHRGDRSAFEVTLRSPASAAAGFEIVQVDGGDRRP